jgi:hypothetical protein
MRDRRFRATRRPGSQKTESTKSVDELVRELKGMTSSSPSNYRERSLKIHEIGRAHV